MDLKAIFRSLPLSILALLLVVGVLYATTTIGTNISTDGTLSVGSTSSLSDTVTLDTADLKVSNGYGLDTSAAGILSIGTTTATTINIGNTSATGNFSGSTINLGADSAASTVTLGNNTTVSAVNVKSGSGAINFTGETVFGNTSNVSYTSQTVLDSSPALTLTPTSTYVVLQCNGGTAVTLDETGARAGQFLVVTVDGVTNTAGYCVFNNSAGVQYVAGDSSVSIDDFDSISFIYDGSSWIQIGASNN